MKFGGTTASPYNSWSDTKVVCVTPAHTAGAVGVVLTRNDGRSGTGPAPLGYTYIPDPVITTVVPSSGTTDGGTSVTLTGTNFGSSRGTGIVKFGGTLATSYTSWSDTTVVCVTPAHVAGAIDVVLTRSDGRIGTKASGYTYILPAAPSDNLAFDPSVPKTTKLAQNYPNPFNPETWIPYQLHESGEVVIRIYSVTGELARELRLGYKPAGLYATQDRSAYWDGRNEAGERVSSGVYFYNIQIGNYNATMKMIVTK